MSETCKEHVKPVRIKPKMTVNEIVLEMSRAGCFGAGRLAMAVNIYERMLKENVLVVFGLAGAMVPAGMKQIVVEMIKRKMVNVIVSTGANMVHDSLEALGGVHYKNVEWANDDVLFKQGVDRIYDVFVTEEDFKEKFDEPMLDILDEISREKGDKIFSSPEFFEEIGKRIKDENSIVYNAYEHKVPIFVPAIQDSCFGLSIWEYTEKYGRKSIVVDAFKELHEFFEFLKKFEKRGALIVGGGVPKNFIFQAAFELKKPYDYAIQITMDRPETGGLSGATLEEAISWGKLSTNTGKVQVIGDATVCLPILVAAVMERLFEK